MKKTIYFAHPKNTYSKVLEILLIKKIQARFPDFAIINPGEKKHQQECESRKTSGLNVMDYFFKEVLPPCSACVCLAFRDGKFGAGVYGEAKFFTERGDPLFIITPEGEIKEAKFEDMAGLTVEETRERVKTAY